MSTPDIIDDWTASTESRSITPFAIADDALAFCGIRWQNSQEYISETDKIKSFGENPLTLPEESFTPELKLSIDISSIDHQVGIDSKDLKVVISARERAGWRFASVKDWPLGEQPETYKFDDEFINSLAGHRGFEFVVSIVCAKSTIDKHGTNLSAGLLIASKRLKINIEDEQATGGFPVEPCDPEDFDDNIDKNAAWFIRWEDHDAITDPDANAAEILTVLVNKNCSDRLYHLKSNDSVGTILWLEIASDILTEICLVILMHDELSTPSKESTGFVAKTIRALVNKTEMSFEELKHLATSSPHRVTSIIRSHLQGQFDYLKAVKKSDIGSRDL